MALADGVKRCRFCNAELDTEFWSAEPAPRTAPAGGGTELFPPGPRPEAGQGNPNSTLTPLPWGASGSGASPLPSTEGRRPHSRVSPLPGTSEAGGRLAPLSFEAANELAKRGPSISSPAITPPPPPAAPPAPQLQANLQVVGYVFLVLVVLALALWLRSATDGKPEAGSPAAVCAESCEAESKTSPESQADPQAFMSSCMSKCLRPAPEKKVR